MDFATKPVERREDDGSVVHTVEIHLDAEGATQLSDAFYQTARHSEGKG